MIRFTARGAISTPDRFAMAVAGVVKVFVLVVGPFLGMPGGAASLSGFLRWPTWIQ